MAVKTFTTGEVLTAADTNTYLNNGGLVWISSTTVGSAVASVTISNCFSSTYDNYRIVYNGIQTSGTNAIGLTLNGSAGSTYNDAGFYIATGTATIVTETLAATVRIRIGICEAGPTTLAGWFDCFGPNVSGRTWANGGSMTPNYSNWRQGTDTNTASHVSFTLTPLAGTFTGGTITVYGYRKA
jgi:hypothetical protein